MRGQYHDIRWIEAKCDKYTTVPPFGLVAVTGATLEGPGRMVLTVERPSSDNQWPLAVNSYRHIPLGEYGLVTMDSPVCVLYAGGDEPAIGETWGAAVDSFRATKGKTGLTIVGKVQGDDRKITLARLEKAGGECNLIGGCLAENHPGRGTVFTLHLGTWNADDHKWVYDMESTVKAIDWRYGVPYPAAGATGLFTPRASTAHGLIYECVSLDCESPGTCGS